MQSLVLYIGFGLVTASILCIGAVSFTLQFGISNLFNLAFGATMTAAAFVAYVCNSAGLNIWLSLVLGTLAASLLSFLLNRGIYTPVQRPRHEQVHDDHGDARRRHHHSVRDRGDLGGRQLLLQHGSRDVPCISPACSSPRRS